MPSHKFAVGQKVRFTPDLGQLANRGEVFVIMRQLPEAAGLLQYQIRSEIDGHTGWSGRASSRIYDPATDGQEDKKGAPFLAPLVHYSAVM